MTQIYIVASVTEDNYIEVDSYYNSNSYYKALNRSNVLMDEDDREWEVLICELGVE